MFDIQIFNCWQVKTIISAVVTVITFLCGEIDAAFIALWLLVILDTLSKWLAISKKVTEENNETSLIAGFYLAWHTGALSSREMRLKFFSKTFSYLSLIIMASLLSKTFPDFSVFGRQISSIPIGFITAYLSLTEAMSICENAIEGGLDALKPLQRFLSAKRDELTGGK